MDVWIIRIVDGHRRKTQRAAALGRAYAHQVCSRAGPVQAGMPGHSQYAGIINTQSIFQIIEIRGLADVVLKFLFGHLDSMQSALENPKQLLFASIAQWRFLCRLFVG